MAITKEMEQTAKKRMMEFVQKHKGKSVLFAGLDNEGKYDYILVKSYRYFRGFLSVSAAVERAVTNATSHKTLKFQHYDLNGTEGMVIV